MLAFIFKSVEEYPGIYSFIGVKVMINVDTKISRKDKTPPKTKTFKRDNFKEKRSSKVSSFKTTNLYLSVSFCFSLPFFLVLLSTDNFLDFTIV